MCEMCDNREFAAQLARDLRKIAAHFDAVSSGHIKPHTKEMAAIGVNVKWLTKYFVANWM